MIASLFAAVLLASAQDEPAPFDSQARVTEAIAAVRPIALAPAGVDWATLEADLRREAERATDTVDMLPIYVRLLDALGDHHSFVQADPDLLAAFSARHGRGLYEGRPRRPLSSAFIGRAEIAGRDLSVAGGRTVRLVVTPQIFGGGAAARGAAQRLFDAVAEGADAACGYIVDLRGNQGGNVWPMLVGLSPLLGDGPQGRERNAAGEDSYYARLEEGVAIVLEGEYGGMAMTRAEAWRPLPRLRELPVAILTDDAVASSGEGVAVAFRGRPATRYFGQQTNGTASSNSGVTLSDGVNLVVTVGMMVDRDGRTYPDGVPVDVEVTHGEDEAADPEDAVVEAARGWLASQPACRS